MNLPLKIDVHDLKEWRDELDEIIKQAEKISEISEKKAQAITDLGVPKEIATRIIDILFEEMP